MSWDVDMEKKIETLEHRAKLAADYENDLKLMNNPYKPSKEKLIQNRKEAAFRAKFFRV